MNIAYLWQREDVDLDQPTGPNLHVRAVIQSLKRRGHHVRLIASRDGHLAFTDDFAQWHWLEPRITRSVWFRTPERTIRGIQSRLRLPYARLFESAHFADSMLPAVQGCDLLYERYDLLGTAGWMASRRLAVPLLLEVNGEIFTEYADLGMGLSAAQWRLINLIERQHFLGAAHTITVSEALRDDALARWSLPPDRVSVVKNGVDVELFNFDLSAGLGQAPSTDNEQLTIIHVGSFQPWHSLDLLVQAFAGIPLTHNARLLLVGDGPSCAEIAALVHRCGLDDRVTFTGRVPHDEVATLMAKAEVAVMAHRPTKAAVSGTPLKLLEYMAAGKAIVAPNLANLAAIVRNGESALLFRPGDADLLTFSLTELLTNESLRAQLGVNAREIARTQYSWDAVASRIESIMIDAGGGQPSYVYS